MPQISNGIGLLLIVFAISVLPFVAMVTSSYVKVVVVLGLLRNALGVQQVPPNMVLNSIAILVSIYVMAPIGMAAFAATEGQPVTDQSSLQTITQTFEAAREPFRDFLKKHTQEREKRFFVRSAFVLWPKEEAAKLQENDFIVLAPAFLLTELTDAFRIGFLLYLAFILVDLIIANILLAMGLNQVTPTNIAIPFKLLLFVLMDGWSTLIHGLVLTYR
jgi:type III secretion protein R